MSRCALVTTGGTIVSRIDERTGLAMPVLSGDELVQTLQGLTDTADLEVIDYIRVASPQIAPHHWVGLHDRIQALVERDDIAGVVVTHGTSTLEETAWFLDLTLDTDKPVVLTGAQRNVSEAGFDGPRNLLAALRVCRCEDARGLGVLVVLNDHINAAREVTKTHTLDVETFQSGEWGYLGSLVKDRVVFHRRPSRRLHLPLPGRGAAAGGDRVHVCRRKRRHGQGGRRLGGARRGGPGRRVGPCQRGDAGGHRRGAGARHCRWSCPRGYRRAVPGSAMALPDRRRSSCRRARC